MEILTEKRQSREVSEVGEPGEVDDDLPVICREAPGKCTVSAHQDADTCEDLSIAEVDNTLVLH